MTTEIPNKVMDAAFRNARIIADVLHILPVGNIKEHTPESIPDRVKELVMEHACYHAALEKIADGTKHAKELAQNTLGYTDNEHYHIELLREENLMLKLKVEELETKACLTLLDKGLSDWDETEAEEGHD